MSSICYSVGEHSRTKRASSYEQGVGLGDDQGVGEGVQVYKLALPAATNSSIGTKARH